MGSFTNLWKITILVISILLPATLYADKIYLKKGKVIEGKIVAETNDTISIEREMGEYGGLVSTHFKTEIKKVEKSSPQEIKSLEQKREEEQRNIEPTPYTPPQPSTNIAAPKIIHTSIPIVENPGDIRSMSLHAYRRGKDIVGYVIFKDKYNRHCCTRGNLGIFRNRKFYANDGKGGSYLATDDTVIIKNVTFSPQDFNGNILPFSFESKWIKPDDILIVKFEHLKRQIKFY